MKPVISNLPNALSLLRILFSTVLLFVDSAPGFAACYLICGVSDVLDGWIARRWRLESRLGAKLDSLGDFAFWAIIFYLLFARIPSMRSGMVLVGLCGVALIRSVNLAITKIRFRQWGMLHTWGNKAAGLLLYLLLPVCIVLKDIPFSIAAILLAAAYLSALEESLIVFTTRRYNPNRKSLFISDAE